MHAHFYSPVPKLVHMNEHEHVARCHPGLETQRRGANIKFDLTFLHLAVKHSRMNAAPGNSAVILSSRLVRNTLM